MQISYILITIRKAKKNWNYLTVRRLIDQSCWKIIEEKQKWIKNKGSW